MDIIFVLLAICALGALIKFRKEIGSAFRGRFGSKSNSGPSDFEK